MVPGKNKSTMKLLKYLLCFICGHDWTCHASKGIQPTEKQLADRHEGFKDYSKMYCDRCGKQSKLNDVL